MRTLLAEAYLAARRRRFSLGTITVPAGDSVDITELCPDQADCGDSPEFDLVVSINPAVIATNLVGVAVVDDGSAVASVLYPWTAEEETDCIRVRGLFPREGTGGAAILRTPFPRAASANGRLNNRVLLVNEDADPWSLPVAIEIPDLAWRGSDGRGPRDGVYSSLAVEYESAPRARFNAAVANPLADGGVVDLTPFVPSRAEVGDTPFVDLLLCYTVLDPTTGPIVGIVRDPADMTAAFAAYQKLAVAAGVATVRVRKIPVRHNPTDTELSDGTRLFVANPDPAEAYACPYVFEAPSLDWV